MTMKLTEPRTTVEPDNTDVVISVENLSKKFCRSLKQSLFYGLRDIVTELVGGNRHSNELRTEEFWALKDISFQLRRGESLGLVGANGAGKSTLLRIISGLINPDTGSVKVKGRVAPLIALNAGFNPVLTGRENIYANMSILGLSTKEIEAKFEDVIEFAEIADAIDSPVQTYSSGMVARLGFSCAIHTEPEILLIDEVLAVGDIKFKTKCRDRLAQLREKGTAFVLVSHNSHNLLNMCNNSVYLKKGQLILSGDTEEVIHKYEEDLCLSGLEDASGRLILPEKPESESFGLDIRTVSFKDEQGNPLKTLHCGEPATLCVECKSYVSVEDGNLGMLVTALSGENDLTLYITTVSDNEYLQISPGYSEIQMHLPYIGLIPGVYRAKIYIRTGWRSLDVVKSFRFKVSAGRTVSRCLFYQPRTWKVVSKERV